MYTAQVKWCALKGTRVASSENDGVILWQLEVCLCFYLLTLTLSPVEMNPHKYQV